MFNTNNNVQGSGHGHSGKWGREVDYAYFGLDEFGEMRLNFTNLCLLKRRLADEYMYYAQQAFPTAN